VLLFLLVLMASIQGYAATAQPKDPFRPPGTSGSELSGGGGSDNVRRVNPPRDPVPPDDGIARTGQDVGSPFAAGVALIAFGLALLLTERAIRHPGPGRSRSLGRRPTAA